MRFDPAPVTMRDLWCFLLGFLLLARVNLSDAQLLDALSNNDPAECMSDIDLVLLLDGSYSVTRDKFEVVKTWVKQLARGFRIENGKVQIGVVQYSHYFPSRALDRQRFIRTEIALGQFSDEHFYEAVDRIQYQGYKTFTAHALEKVLKYDLKGLKNRYPHAQRAIVLLTDGKATDESHLARVVRLAEREGAAIYAIGIGDFSADQLRLITGGRESRVFQLRDFDHLRDIVDRLNRQLTFGCDCDARGSVSTGECDPCTHQCVCKPHVVGVACDSCADGFYGEPGACQECGCDERGTATNVTSCSGQDGACQCRHAGLGGRTCDRCADGHFDFPACGACECGGFSSHCWGDGVCIGCAAGRVGDHCEKCRAGHYWTGTECAQCECNGHVDLSDPGACHPTTGECLKCRNHTAGPSCETCAESFYFDDAANQCREWRWGEWTSTPCSVTCGEGTREDTRACLPAGASCPGESSRIITCSLPSCPEWTAWSSWAECDVTCGGGLRNRRRTCDDEGDCLGDEHDAEACNTGDCPEWTSWSAWAACDVTCGGGLRHRIRTCGDVGRGDAELANCPGHSSETDSCNGGKCPERRPWSAWSTCDVTCGAGSRQRTRACDITDGGGCPGEGVQTKACTFGPCRALSPVKPTARQRPLPVKAGWSPCVGCGGSWPSYCRGWMCKRRWPHQQQTYSRQRCSTYNWGCRYRVEQSSRGKALSEVYRRPTYYRGVFHHPRYTNYNNNPARYNLYRT